jgi:TolB-like protein/lipoprotein NlpI
VADWAGTGQSTLTGAINVTSKLSLFLSELKRRKVYHVAVAYVVVGAILGGIANDFLPNLDAPEWAVGFILVLIIIGFPIALVLAWAYEVRPEEPRETEPTPAAFIDTPETEQRKSIVVLPFDNMSPDPGDAYFADGLTEEIITNLSRIRSLRVISRNSAMVLKGTQKDTRTIAKELDVQYVLEGSVRKAGDDLRITAQLIDASFDEHVWAEKYDGVLDDVFGIQERVSGSIVKTMELRLQPEEERRLAQRSIESPQAYECYLRAKSHMWLLTEETHDQALELVERGLAIAGDSDILYALKGQIFFHHVDQMNRPPETYPSLLDEGRACADKALAINPHSAPAHELLGWIAQQSADPQGVLRHFGRALQLDPNSSAAHLMGGFGRAKAGVDLETARGLLERLAELDPLTPMNKGGLGWLHWFEGRFDLALEGWREWQQETERVRSPYRLFFAFLHAADGHLQEAVRLVELVERDSPEHTLTALGTFLKRAWFGEKEQALAAVTEDLEKGAWWDDGWSLYMADAYAMIGECDRAFHWLERAIDYGHTNVKYLRNHHPFLENLRSDDRFERLMENANANLQSLMDSQAVGTGVGAWL